MNFAKNNFLIVVSAPSGGGKTTINKEILERNDNIVYSISYTTRQPRETEKDGVDYFFVDERKFKKMVADGEFLEYAKVHNNWYGTSLSFIKSQLVKNKHVIMDIDVQGAQEIATNSVDKILIFLLPPNQSILKNRLKKRGTDSYKEIELRLKNAHSEIEKVDDYDYLVINDDLEVAVEDVEAIIRAEENSEKRYRKIRQSFYEEGE
ncbi:MAG: guanylate kinase [Candidatus Cloacimonadota bacterium]|nr:guanylate kinase [Candidatus Cloacimonadota bacterium]